ncbi:ParB N-terminal domain-containing protein [Sphingomonas sp. NSE70-1]|uniref:ParB N-terminal domain-containing protein n=1 Tax=Sphingomonas caseinilyticus TaxID=2908205 RepID=A0ABT0RWZ6_9SPHN|nr:ParB N-terminal domain-containing protein [Sphingomonas caseinilyticus]MCL6699544.1 ParB N-terminal domain-containing protein [Sphingomonas caseinilyticus]
MATASNTPSTPLGPRTVPTDSLIPNPHNPRVLFDELPLRTLEESIRRVGILVPITVFQATGSKKYTILDGQRRWICAQRLALADVPINQVQEPTVAQNIVTMFQIHKLRKDWELMPTALKLGVLMNELDERRDAQLADLTGLDVAVVTRCKKLLWYPKQYQEMMLYADPEDRIKADFFIELYPILTDRLVSRAQWYDRDMIIDRFLVKYQEKLSGFKSITDFRKIKQHISVARAAGHEDQILDRLHRFILDDRIDIEDLEIDTAKVHRRASVLVRTLAKLMDQLREVEAEAFLGEEDLWVELEELHALINSKLAEADRRPK